MRLPNPVLRRLRMYAARVMATRPPEFTIADAGDPYLHRWFVMRHGQRWARLTPAERTAILDENNARDDSDHWTAVNAYIHQFRRSDKDTVHDHPWRSLSIILDGWYLEHTPMYHHDLAGPTQTVRRNPGDIVPRWSPTAPHRIELADGPVTTLFITGPKLREWGFWCHAGWTHWRRFIKRGCE